jgi:hypothetical protein
LRCCAKTPSKRNKISMPIEEAVGCQQRCGLLGGLPQRDNQGIRCHRDSRAQACPDQRAQYGVPGQRRAGTAVVTAVHEHRIVDGRAQRSQMVMVAGQLGCAFQAERVRQADAIEHGDQMRTHRPGERARGVRPAQCLFTGTACAQAGLCFPQGFGGLVGTRRDPYDAQLAAGRDVDLAPEAAADGIDEWPGLTAASTGGTPDPARAQDPRGDGQSLHFHAAGPGLSGTGQWLVTRTPSGVTVTRGHGKADVAVRGPAARLLLVLTRRLPPSAPAIEVPGEQALLTHWLQHTPF